jgi:hypothetical protein
MFHKPLATKPSASTTFDILKAMREEISTKGELTPLINFASWVLVVEGNTTVV